MTRVVLVGAGHLGSLHLKKIAMSSARLVGVVDVDAVRRQEVAAACRVPCAAALSDLAADADACIIATPTTTHLDIMMQALARHLDIFVEKPLATDPVAARDVVAQAAAAGRIVQVGHSERFNPAIERALALAREPMYVDAERLGPFTGRSTDVDVIFDLMIHDLDIVLAMIDAPLQEVRAVGVPVLTDAVDMAAVRLQFGNGAVAQLSAGRASMQPSRKLRLFTRDRYVSVDAAAREIKSVRRSRGPMGLQIEGEAIDVPEQDALQRQLADFLAAVVTRVPPRVTGAAGVAAVELAAAIAGVIETQRRDWPGIGP
jgi:predicted dehydrogenase